MNKISFLLFPLAIVYLLTSCATPLSAKASKIQVHSQSSTLIANCKNIGPVTANSNYFGYEAALAEVKNKIRETVADKGGDTLAILGNERVGSSLVMQGTALKCY